MIFIVAHYANAFQATEIANIYASLNQEILLCGSADFDIEINASIPYHPIVKVFGNATNVIQQHRYIDDMCRAIQIEVPSRIIFHSPTKLDTHTVLFRIKEHAQIVGVEIT
jgi:hypothetical protein